MSLINVQRFVSLDTPKCLICYAYVKSMNVNHTSDQCPQLWKNFECFKCLGHHLTLNCLNCIPSLQNNCCMCHFFARQPFIKEYLVAQRKIWNSLQGATSRGTLSDAHMGNLATQPFGLGKGHTRLVGGCCQQCQHGSLDGRQGPRSIHQQLHSGYRCMRLFHRAQQPRKFRTKAKF